MSVLHWAVRGLAGAMNIVASHIQAGGPVDQQDVDDLEYLSRKMLDMFCLARGEPVALEPAPRKYL